MLILKWLAMLLLVLVAAAIAAGQSGMLQGKPPDDLGVHAGKLKAPSMTENSVSSQAGLYPDHPQRLYASTRPLALRGDGTATMATLMGVVQAMPGAKLVKSEPDYLYFQFTTAWMRFVDDVEFWYDPEAKAIQVRSASRLGQRDMGVNRQRVETVRKALADSP